MVIEDKGNGFNPAESANKSGHIGLKTMDERARLIGANFELSSAENLGTKITISGISYENSEQL
jgi:signal transduction histidine kinase